MESRSSRQEKLQKKITVSLEVELQEGLEDCSFMGSGTLFPVPESDLCLVITAKHCLLGKREENGKYPYSVSEIEKITLRYKFYNDTKSFNSIEIDQTQVLCEEGDLNIDIALIVLNKDDVKEQLLELSEIPELILLEEGYEGKPYDSLGYPKVFFPDYQYVPSKYVEDLQYSVEIEVNNLAPTDGALASDKIGGFSGSGVLVRNHNYLSGVISKLKDPSGYFNMVLYTKIKYINKILDGNSFGIPLLKLEQQLPQFGHEVKERLVNDVGVPDNNNVKYILNLKIDTFVDLNKPSPSENKIPRTETITRIKNCSGFKNNTWLNVLGAGGSGKTELLLDLFQDEEKVLWFDFEKGKTLREMFTNLKVQGKSEALTWDEFVDGLNESYSIVFDSFPPIPTSEKETILPKIEQLVEKLGKTGGKILSTSRNDFSHLFTEGRIYTFKIPPLSQKEIEKYLEEQYVPTSSINKYSESIVSVGDKTPILTKDLILFLKQKQWNVELDQLPILFLKDRKESFSERIKNLINQTLKSNEKELLYRLTLLIGSFSKRVIDIVANVSPKIREYESALNSIKGIWLEVVDKEGRVYQGSKLLNYIRHEEVAKDTQIEIYSLLTGDLLKSKTLSLSSLYKAILYSYKGGKSRQTASLLINGLMNFEEKPELFYEYKFSDFWYYSELPETFNSLEKQIIRSYQLRYSIRMDKDEDAFFIVEELDKYGEELFQNGYIQTYYITLLILTLSKKNPQRASIWAERLYTHNDKESTDHSLLSDFRIEGEKDWLFISVLYDSKTVNDVIAWFESYDNILYETNFDDNSLKLIPFYRVPYTLFEVEKNKEKPNYAQLISDLSLIARESAKRQLIVLCAQCYRKIIIIYLKELNDTNSAKEIVKKQITNQTGDKYLNWILLATLGTELFVKHKRKDALLYLRRWSEMFDVEEKDRLTITLDMDMGLVVDASLYYRTFLADTTKLIKYSELAYRILSGDSFLDINTQCVILGEYSSDLFLIKEYSESIYVLEQGIYKILSLDSISDSLKVLLLKYTHNLNYIRASLFEKKLPEKNIDGSKYAPPFVGYFLRKSLQLLEFYFPERKFMAALMIFSALGDLEDWEAVSKWNSIILREREYVEYYDPLSILLVPYLIKEYRFIEAADLYRDVLKKDQYIQNNKDEIIKVAPHEKIGAQLKDRKGLFEYTPYKELGMVFVPALIRELMGGKKMKTNLVNCLSYIEVWNEEAGQDFLSKIQEILTLYLKNEITKDNLIETLNSENKEAQPAINIIGQVLFAENADIQTSFICHVQIIQSIHNDYKDWKSLCQLIIVPYFVSFWKIRFEESPKRFLFSKGLDEKGFPSIEKERMDNRLFKLFRVLRHHIEMDELKFSQEIMNFLEL